MMEEGNIWSISVTVVHLLTLMFYSSFERRFLCVWVWAPASSDVGRIENHRKRKLAEFLQLERYSDETMIKFP